MKKITVYHIGSSRGISARILNYGCTITDIIVPDRSGELQNIVLRLHDDEAYTGNHPYIGATVGRYANRIAGGRFEIDGSSYKLSRNEPPNHLHGGHQGFSRKLWTCIRYEKNLVVFEYTSKNGEEGYPGTLTIKAEFKISDEHKLTVTYYAESDHVTPVNVTNHSYFNLSGNPGRTIGDHRLHIYSDRYTPVNDVGIPDGRVIPVHDTVYDFRSGSDVGAAINTINNGLDVNYVLQSRKYPKKIRKAVRVEDPKSGRVLEVYTNKPGMQLYTGGGLDGSLKDPYGRALIQYSGLCLETQFFPDAPNKPQFPSPFLRSDDIYHYQTIYRFSDSG